MKNIMVLLLCALLSFGAKAQSIIGAWEAIETNKSGDKIRNVVVFVDGYQVLTKYDATTGKFIHTNGGSWKLDGNIITEKVEFDSDNPERVGTEVSFKVAITDSVIDLTHRNMKLKKIDKGTPGQLQGAWLMSGRIRDGKTQSRDTSRPRKTMKILSGTRFHWIAYNMETKQFMGTGGGKYTTINGEYTETIEFFSKDDSKVGLSLAFNFELIDGKWNHTGSSSKGDPIHEIWSKRSE